MTIDIEAIKVRMERRLADASLIDTICDCHTLLAALDERDATIRELMEETAASQAALLWAADLYEAWVRDYENQPRGNWERPTWGLLGIALSNPIIHRLVGYRAALAKEA